MLINIDILKQMRRVCIQFLNLIEDCLIQEKELECRSVTMSTEERRIEHRREQRKQQQN